MAASHAGAILDHIRSFAETHAVRSLSDGQLLERFTAQRDGEAFATLMRRHGRLVWTVCRHILLSEHDAEDAFQAAFLVLARRAASIRKTEAVAEWLHGVAYRIAVRAKQMAAKRLGRERQAAAALGRWEDQATTVVPPDAALHELQALLQEEVARLPEKYRTPFVLCCLEGRCWKEAAGELGWKEGTLATRIAQARKLLQTRLARRGVTLSSALTAGVLWGKPASAALIQATQKAAALIATGQTVSAAASPAVAVLVERAVGVVGTKAKLAVILVFVGIIGGSLGLATSEQPAVPGQQSKGEGTKADAALAKADERKAGSDAHGDSLPPGALARLGTLRQRAPDAQIAVTTDGKEIVTVGSGLTVRRFDAGTGDLLTTRQIADSNSPAIWLSPKGGYVLVTRYGPRKGYELELWEVASGQRLKTVSLDGSFPSGAAFAADERTVAIADSGPDFDTHRVWVWHVEDAKPRLIWSEKKAINERYYEPVVAISRDGKRLIACHLDLILRCWEVEGGKLSWQSDRRNWTPYLFFSPDGRTVVTAANIGIAGVQFRDSVTGKLSEEKKPPPEALFPVGFSPDGRYMAFQTGQEGMVLWEPGSDRVAFAFPPPSRRRDAIQHNPNRLPTNFAFTPDGKGLIRRGGALQRWDLTTGKPTFADTEDWGHTEPITKLLFSPDGKLLASVAKDQTVRTWEIATGRTQHTFPASSNHLAFTRDGRYLVTVPFGLGKTALQAWNLTTGRADRGFELEDRTEFVLGSRERELVITADSKKILMLTWKNGKRDDECMLTAWDAASHACLMHQRVPWSEDSVLTPDGEGVLALDSRSGRVQLLAIDTGQPRWVFQAQSVRDKNRIPSGCDLALSPNGRLMAARIRWIDATSRQTQYDAVRLGDMAGGSELLSLAVEGPAVFSFSADDRLFAIASTDGITLWETASWKKVGIIQAPDRHGARPRQPAADAMAFGPDGRILATCHSDSCILLWDATLRDGRQPESLSTAQVDALWADLYGADAALAYAAVWRLAGDPKQSVASLAERLKPVTPPSPDEALALLKDLDSEEFADRVAAEKKLSDLGERAEPALRRALANHPSAEARRRIERLLGKPRDASPSSEQLRSLRGVAVLEHIGTPEARRVLAGLAKGVPEARLTLEAKAALERLEKRQ